MRYFIAFTLFALVGGCGDSKFAKLSDSELQERFSACKSSNMSPGAAITCDNIKRECERRAGEKGHNLCY